MKYADIEYSKELKNYFPESEWWYWIYKSNVQIGKENTFTPVSTNSTKEPISIMSWDWRKDKKNFAHKLKECYPALTTDMLLERLPKELKIKEVYCCLRIGCFNDFFSAYYESLGYTSDTYFPEDKVHDKSLPNALAKMMIWLIKEGLINDA